MFAYIRKYILGNNRTERAGFLSRSLTEYNETHPLVTTNSNPTSSESHAINMENVENAENEENAENVENVDMENVLTPNQLNDNRNARVLIGDSIEETINLNYSVRERFMNMVSQGQYVEKCYTFRYAPFFVFIIVKWLYDYKVAVANIFVLCFAYYRANDNLKSEIRKREGRNNFVLLAILVYTIACITLVYYTFDTHIFSLYTEKLTISNLVVSIAITDIVLKLITIHCKLILTSLPFRWLSLRKRMMFYPILEAMSQLYRSVAPIQGWAFYLFYCSYGEDEVMSRTVMLLFYAICKFIDIFVRFNQFRTAIKKFGKNGSIGISPSKEQLLLAGEVCAICHEEYQFPTTMRCGHIFCEVCVSTWIDRGPSCPLCRADLHQELHNLTYRDGHTTYSFQLY